MSPQGIVFPSLGALYGEFQVLLHEKSYHSFDDLQKVKGSVARLMLRENTEGLV